MEKNFSLQPLEGRMKKGTLIYFAGGGSAWYERVKKASMVEERRIFLYGALCGISGSVVGTLVAHWILYRRR